MLGLRVIDASDRLLSTLPPWLPTKVSPGTDLPSNGSFRTDFPTNVSSGKNSASQKRELETQPLTVRALSGKAMRTSSL